jgi:hypothetical protein
MTPNNHSQRWTIPIQVTVTLGSPEMALQEPLPDRGGGEVALKSFVGQISELASNRFDRASLTDIEFSWRAALSLALASKLSYENAASVQSTTRTIWGLDTCEFFEVDETQCFIASTVDAVLVTFRGTESLGDWLGNLNLLSTTRPYGVVHRGFLSAFQVVESRLRTLIQGLGRRRIVLTGHSLGGALATVAAAEWQGQFPISGIYTYGQPAVGKGEFTNHIAQHYRDSFFRFVNDDDIVPQVPPSYEHVGKLIHFKSNGSIITNTEAAIMETAVTRENQGPPMLTEAEFDELRSQLLARKAVRSAGGRESARSSALEGFFTGFSDHRIDNYIAKIASRAEMV